MWKCALKFEEFTKDQLHFRDLVFSFLEKMEAFPVACFLVTIGCWSVACFVFSCKKDKRGK